MKLMYYIDETLQGKLNLDSFFELTENRLDDLRRFDLDVDHQILKSNGELMVLEDLVESELALINKNKSILDGLMDDIDLRQDMNMTLLDVMDIIRLEECIKEGVYEN